MTDKIGRVDQGPLSVLLAKWLLNDSSLKLVQVREKDQPESVISGDRARQKRPVREEGGRPQRRMSEK
ncbi:hypothetical protein XH88_18945 [Bradyrhizobium sp. CCBAU 51627]|nr:hypothetical protein [Bradyrhizobium sp. CCBAU 51627]